MAYTATGKLIFISPDTKKITDKFKTREFWLELRGPKPNFYLTQARFQAINACCTAMDDFSIGDNVKIEFGLSGKVLKKSDGTEYCVTNLDVSTIKLAPVD